MRGLIRRARQAFRSCTVSVRHKGVGRAGRAGIVADDGFRGSRGTFYTHTTREVPPRLTLTLNFFCRTKPRDTVIPAGSTRRSVADVSFEGVLGTGSASVRVTVQKVSWRAHAIIHRG